LEKVTIRRRAAKAPVDLKELCAVTAYALIADHGIERLSIREVARRLNISHQAPYKHYPTKDHLLAEVMRRCFERFRKHLDQDTSTDEPGQDLATIGRRYLEFASTYPLEYQLMFSTPWPSAKEHAALLSDANHAFDVLRKAFIRLHGNSKKQAATDAVELNALYVWSCMHGIAGLMQSNVLKNLALRRDVLDNAVQHMMLMMKQSLQYDQPPYNFNATLPTGTSAKSTASFLRRPNKLG
jgi:AcrR family transcriptional regulator